MDKVIELHKEEISTYLQHIEELKKRNRDCDERNAALIQKIQSLESLVEKANVCNQDLNVAFKHIHEENVRLKANPPQPESQMITNLEQLAETDRKEDLGAESLVWISEREQFKKRNKFLEREVQRYHRDNMHLGKQVRHLLKTLEEERGIIVRRQSQVSQDNQLMCAADVIDKHLITFESIEELQQQNQKLLSLVKDLSSEQEEREIKVESDEVKKLTTNLAELQSQLDTIKDDRERMINTLKTIHRERDLFKILLCNTRQVEHLTPEIFQRMVSVACSAGPAIAGPDASSIEREAHIEDLKRMISNLEHNLESIKKELTDSQATSAAELSLKNQLLEKAHLKISEVIKTLEFANERNELLETNNKALTSEFDELRTKHQKMTLEFETLRKNLDEVDQKLKENVKLLDVEKKRAQDALLEASNLKNENQLMSESIQSEKVTRRQELASLFREFQDKQSREFEVYNKKQVDLELRMSEANAKFNYMQMQRNCERKRRIVLDRLVNTKRRPSPKERKVVKRKDKQPQQQLKLEVESQVQRTCTEEVPQMEIAQEMNAPPQPGIIRLKRRKFD